MSAEHLQGEEGEISQSDSSKPGPDAQWTERVNLQFAPKHVEAMDKYAQEMGISRSAFVRVAVTKYLKNIKAESAD